MREGGGEAVGGWDDVGGGGWRRRRRGRLQPLCGGGGGCGGPGAAGGTARSPDLDGVSEWGILEKHPVSRLQFLPPGNHHRYKMFFRNCLVSVNAFCYRSLFVVELLVCVFTDRDLFSTQHQWKTNHT